MGFLTKKRQTKRQRVELEAVVSPTADTARVTVSFRGGNVGQLNRPSVLILALTDIHSYLEQEYGMKNVSLLQSNIETGRWRETWPKGPNYLR
ncbi:MAG: hypothetical protein GTO22_00395 [Gemmatimonadales bacterium]|nr:hypothetical protein [Gemmatimonadales bacterium]